jgi:hypothetical protein
LDDLSILGWLWHDSEPQSLVLGWNGTDNPSITVTLRSVLHPDEDWQMLAPYGVTGPEVAVVLDDASDIAIRDLAATADRGVIVSWSLTPARTVGARSRHVITLSTGATVEATCGAVYVSNATDDA